MALVTRTLDSLRSCLGSFAWSPLVDISRRTILGLLRGIEVGRLAIVDSDGTVVTCGAERDAGHHEPNTTLKILKEAFWPRLLLFADMVGANPSI